MNRAGIRLKKPHSRHFRLGLRTSLVAMTLIAVAIRFGVSAYHSHIEWTQFQRSYQKFVAKTSFTDADLACMTSYLLEQHLERLDLSNTLITDEAASSLDQFTSLKQLYLNGTRFSDRGLAQLHDLKDLSMISVNGPPITWQGAVTFSAHHPTTAIAVNAGAIAGFVKDSVVTLRFYNPPSPSSFAEIAKIQQLKGLICTTMPLPLSDSDLARLAGCTTLETLELPGAQITDQSVKVILGLKRLQRLTLPESISPAAARKIKEGLPQCREFIYMGH